MKFFSYFDGKHSFHKYFWALYFFFFFFFFFFWGGGGVGGGDRVDKSPYLSPVAKAWL